VQDVAPLKQVTVKNMEKTIFHSNAVFAAKLLNGFVGETHIFVKDVTRDK
jgi:hypothetical protein